jgi:hypothetical protein
MKDQISKRRGHDFESDQTPKGKQKTGRVLVSRVKGLAIILKLISG